METKEKELSQLDLNGENRRKVLLDTGISEEYRGRIAEGLIRTLADSYALMLKTQCYHWNVVGNLFLPIHELTEEHYENLFEAIDDIAERVRALGHHAPGTFSRYMSLTAIPEANENSSALEMIADLLEGHRAVIKTMRSFRAITDEAGDEASLDLITRRLDFHEKASWMLRSMLEI